MAGQGKYYLIFLSCAKVETVLMGYDTTRTACISTQAGCGLGCTFCATGQGTAKKYFSR
jgi:23S rRNA (adenine2503-C2)-methyltransferase